MAGKEMPGTWETISNKANGAKLLRPSENDTDIVLTIFISRWKQKTKTECHQHINIVLVPCRLAVEFPLCRSFTLWRSRDSFPLQHLNIPLKNAWADWAIVIMLVITITSQFSERKGDHEKEGTGPRWTHFDPDCRPILAESSQIWLFGPSKQRKYIGYGT